MDPDASDEMTDHLVDFFDQIAPVYDGWAGGQHARVAARLVIGVGLATVGRRQPMRLLGLVVVAGVVVATVQAVQRGQIATAWRWRRCRSARSCVRSLTRG